jgi:hypothetical protein
MGGGITIGQMSRKGQGISYDTQETPDIKEVHKIMRQKSMMDTERMRNGYDLGKSHLRGCVEC